MSEFMTPSELLKARSAHMDSLNRLRDASKTWHPRDTTRGEATMANLMQQVYQLDAELQAAGIRVNAQ